MHPVTRALLLLLLVLPGCEKETEREVIVVQPSGVSLGAAQLRVTLSIDGGPKSLPELFPPDRTQLNLLLPGTAPGQVEVELQVLDCHRCVMSRGLARVDVTGPGRYDVIVPVQALMAGACDHQQSGKLVHPRWLHQAALLTRGPDAGKVIVLGGAIVNQRVPPAGEDGFPSDIEIYDPAANTSHPSAARLSAGRYKSLLVGLADGRLLVAGGFNGTVPLARVEIYDPDTDRITSVAPMPVARSNFDGALLGDGRVLVTGGTDSFGETLADCELYDPKADSWSVVDSMSVTRHDHAAATLPDGRVMVTGGIANLTMEARVVEIFDGGAAGGRQWSYAGQLAIGHEFHTMTVLPDGRVMVAGGFQWQNLLDLVEVWGGDDWVMGGLLAFPRGRHTATLLPDGRVVIAGGGYSPPIVPVADFFDPKQGKTLFTVQLEVPRTEHTATLLPDGTLLIAGGVGSPGIDTNGGPVLDSVERLVVSACP